MRELRAGRLLSELGASGAGWDDGCASAGATGVEASSWTSTGCSIFAASDRMLASSPRLVGGVEVGGDALVVLRDAACFSVWTVMLDNVDEVDVGDVSRSAMVATRTAKDPVVVVFGGW